MMSGFDAIEWTLEMAELARQVAREIDQLLSGDGVTCSFESGQPIPAVQYSLEFGPEDVADMHDASGAGVGLRGA